MATGDQVTKTGISMPINKIRFTTYPVLSGNCLDIATTDDHVGPVTYAWGSTYSLFFRAYVRSTPLNAARFIDASFNNKVMLTVTGIQCTHNGTSYTSSSVLVINEWHDYAVVYDGVHIRYYRDGVVVECLVAPVAPETNSRAYYFFNRSDGVRQCDMKIAYLQWFNRGMQPEEVFAHYHSDANNTDSLILSYGFQEGTGTAITDASGNGYNTTVTGCTWGTFTLEDTGTNISTYFGSSPITRS